MPWILRTEMRSVFVSCARIGPRSKLSPVDLRLAYPFGATFRSSGTRKLWLNVSAGAQAASASAMIAAVRDIGGSPAPGVHRAGSTRAYTVCIGHLPRGIND